MSDVTKQELKELAVRAGKQVLKAVVIALLTEVAILSTEATKKLSN